MRRKNIFVRCIGLIARKFRALQEVWLLPWWEGGGLATAPLWALDTFVLVVKICSTCAMAVFRVFIPPAMKSLYGETILITGAGGGIGRELAIQFAELGATVVCWDIDARRNNAVVNEIRQKDGDCFGYTVDVTVREQVLSLAARMRRQLTDISIVVSNAGSLTCAPLTSLRPESVARLVEVNLLAHFWDSVSRRLNSAAPCDSQLSSVHLGSASIALSGAGLTLMHIGTPTTISSSNYENSVRDLSTTLNDLSRVSQQVIQAFLPNMIERRQGHIVAINSSAGLMPCADMVPYCAAKFGLRGLMDSLSEELRLDTWTKNINTTTVYLATISTGLYPPPTHRFVSWYSEITAKEAAKIIIEGIRKNKKSISIPSLMKSLIDLNNLMPYRIWIIFSDFFNFGHRGWFCFC